MSQLKELPQVSFAEAAQNVFKKMFQFKGRIRRSEYWWGVLVLTICAIVLSLIPFIGQIAVLFLYIAATSMLFRRLHDTGRSGWWWGCQFCLGFISLIFFATAIDFHAYMQAVAENNATEIIKVISAGLTGTSGVLGLIFYLVASILGLVLFALTLLDSKPEANKYGDSPKYVEENVAEE